MPDHYVVFADGACSGNPGPGGWGAIVVSPQGVVTELGGAERLTTNNQMELTAAIRALQFIDDKNVKIVVHSDSRYVINGITKWVFNWQRKNWKLTDGNDVANRVLWEALVAAVRDRKPRPEWKYVPGHQDIAGNERADRIAVAFSTGGGTSLFRGQLGDYGVDVLTIPELSEEPKSKTNSIKPKKAAAYYLSLIGTQVEKHATWAECERRVRGQSRAKYKKVMSDREAEEILEGWGCKPSSKPS